MIGRALAHYRIVARLGTGGWGEVWRARDTRLGRDVALKPLPPEMAADGRLLDRFRREASVLAALGHPGIVAAHAVEEDRGLCFLAMEVVDGEPLGRTIPEAGLPLGRLLGLGGGLADALSAAHGAGVLHRDLTSANVMVAPGDRPRVLDFGLVGWTDGAGVDSLPYLSPEQLRGGPVDDRSDVFSLGSVLYEMATGVRPFWRGTAAALRSAVLEERPPDVTSMRRGLPRSLGALVARCLEKDPDRRVPSAGDVRDALLALERPLAPATA